MKHPRAYRPRHKSGQMNATERAYSEHLEKLRMAGEIESWDFECETLKIGDDCRYTPDFRVISKCVPYQRSITPKMIKESPGFIDMPGNPCGAVLEGEDLIVSMDSIIEFHEVKGTRKKKGDSATKPFIEDDALVKIKAAAQMHPYKFVIVWKGTNGWEKREIN